MTRKITPTEGSLIKFKNVNREKVKYHVPGWVDEYDNIIPSLSLGMIVSKKYRRLKDWRGWEYDILIPSLGIVSPNWGNFAFDLVE